MTFSLKKVTKIALLSSGVAFIATGCVAGDEPFNPDRDDFYGSEVADPDTQPPPPPIVVDPDDPLPADPFPAVFAPKQANPANLVVTDESIYWTEFASNQVTLHWMHVDGGETFKVGDLDSLPFSAVADETGIYFAASSEQNIVFAPHLGLDAQPLYPSITDPLAVQVTEDFAYWTAADGCLYRGAKEGGSTETVACGAGAPISLSLSEGTAYWATIDGALFSTSLEPTGAVDKIASGEDFSAGIVADQSGIYWVDEGKRQVRRYRFASDSLSVLADNQYQPAGVAQDRFYLYYTTQGDNSVKRVLKAGGEVDLMASGQAEPGQVVATSDFLYWINEGDGTVMRLLKNYDY